MSQYVLSPRARADLDGIWDYTAARWGDTQAERYLREIVTAIQIVANDPRKGRVCNELRAGYRKSPAGSHVFFIGR